MFIYIPLLLIGAGHLVVREIKRRQQMAANPPPIPAPICTLPQGATRSAALVGLESPKKLITLVGRTSAGKSSLGNALMGQAAFSVGVEHGTTSQITTVPYRSGFQLQDTPGLLDGVQYSAQVLDAAKASEVVIFVTTGQLYRQEIDFLRDLCSAQSTWSRTRGLHARRESLVFLNECDLKERSMPTLQRANELAALRKQVSPWLESTAVLSGAAAPLDGGPPWIASLEGYLAHVCRQSFTAT